MTLGPKDCLQGLTDATTIPKFTISCLIYLFTCYVRGIEVHKAIKKQRKAFKKQYLNHKKTVSASENTEMYDRLLRHINNSLINLY